MSFDPISRRIALISLVFLAGCASAPRLEVRPNALPLQRDASARLLLRTRLGNKPALLLLDTGARRMVIKKSRAAYFGIRHVTRGDRLPESVFVNGQPHRVGVIPGFNIRGSAVPIVIGNEAEPESAHSRIDGHIGLDGLRKMRAAIDCATPALVLPTRRGALRRYLLQAGFVEIPLHLKAGHLFGDGTLSGQSGQFALDTGVGPSAFDRDYAVRCKLRVAHAHHLLTATNFRDDAARLSTFRDLRLAGNSLGDGRAVIFHLARFLAKSRWRRAIKIDGLIGAATLAAAGGVIDCANQKLYIRPRAER